MTDEPRNEGVEEEIEDLEAPAESLGDVRGGANPCLGETLATDGHVYLCNTPGSCVHTQAQCLIPSEAIVLHEQ
jgi:hypothetical protein